jgi:histidine triad (HIT) family protein
MGSADCLFCKIIAGQIPSSKVYEDDAVFAFNDISPQAPTHILIVPRKHIDSMDTAAGEDKGLIGHLMLTAAKIARERGFSEGGYRIVVNTNADAGQTVFHLHVHLLAGRQFIFPPG